MTDDPAVGAGRVRSPTHPVIRHATLEALGEMESADDDIPPRRRRDSLRARAVSAAMIAGDDRPSSDQDRPVSHRCGPRRRRAAPRHTRCCSNGIEAAPRRSIHWIDARPSIRALPAHQIREYGQLARQASAMIGQGGVLSCVRGKYGAIGDEKCSSSSRMTPSIRHGRLRIHAPMIAPPTSVNDRVRRLRSPGRIVMTAPFTPPAIASMIARRLLACGRPGASRVPTISSESAARGIPHLFRLADRSRK